MIKLTKERAQESSTLPAELLRLHKAAAKRTQGVTSPREERRCQQLSRQFYYLQEKNRACRQLAAKPAPCLLQVSFGTKNFIF